MDFYDWIVFAMCCTGFIYIIYTMNKCLKGGEVMLRSLISENDFDMLPVQTQISYFYCQHCGAYYLKSEFKECPCMKGGTPNAAKH